MNNIENTFLVAALIFIAGLVCIVLITLNMEYQTCEELLTTIQSGSTHNLSVRTWIAQECWK